MILASIDIGSNTVLLLILDVDLKTKMYKTIQNFYRTPRISEGLKFGELINNNKVDCLFNILDEFNNLMKSFAVEKSLVVATNAFRIARNSSKLVYDIWNKFNLEVKIIDGNEEARLSFIGSVFPLDANEIKTVIDIGGGSTEVISGSMETISFKKSFQIGVVSLTETILLNNPLKLNAISEAELFVEKIFKDLVNSLPNNIDTIAVAGTPTTLSCIKQKIKIYSEEKVENSVLTYADVCNILNEIAPQSKNEMKNNYGQVVEGREDVLLAGTIILKTFMKILQLSEIIVSSKGLRYGVLIDYLLKTN